MTALGKFALIPGVSLLMLGLAGCQSVGPDYRRPAVSLPTSFRNAPGSDLPLLAEPGDAWWKLFADPVLDDLQAAAQSHAPTLQAALAARAAAYARRGVDHAAAKPSVAGAIDATFAGESAEQTIATPAGPITLRERGDSYRLSAASGYEIDLWGRVRRLVERADAQIAASEADLAAVRLSIAGDVAASYFRLRSVEAEAAVLNRRYADQKESIALRQARQISGFNSELEVSRDESELHTLAADLADIERRGELERNILELLTGRSAIPAVEAATRIPEIPAGVPVALLKRRPDVAAAEAQLRARTAEIGIAQAARYPTVQLTGTVGFSATDLGELFARPGQFWGLGPGVSFPLFDGGRGRAQVEAARAAVAESEALFRQQVLVACREVEDALAEGRGLTNREAAQLRAQAAARDVLRLTTVRYEQGLISYFEVIAAQRALLELERSLALLAGQRRLAVVRLVRALGGNWTS